MLLNHLEVVVHHQCSLSHTAFHESYHMFSGHTPVHNCLVVVLHINIQKKGNENFNILLYCTTTHLYNTYQMFHQHAVCDSTSPIIFFFPLFFGLWKIKSFFLNSTFSESMSTDLYYILSTLLIWITSTKCSIPLREFLYHGFW